MRLIRILLVLVGAGVVTLAQTSTPAKVRQLSLQDCIQLALKNNLDLQIDRYNPEISLFTLKANYGGYDPTLSLSGQHDHAETGSQLISGSVATSGAIAPGSISDDNAFSASLGGLLPWGTTYTLGTLTPIQDTYGSNSKLANNYAQPPVSFGTNTLNLTSGNSLSYLTTNYSQILTRQPFENSVGAVGFQVSQPLLKNFWIDQTRLNIRVAKNRLKYSQLTLQLQIMQTVTALEQAYYELIYDGQNVLVQQKAVELAEQLVVENKKRLEVGTLAELDLKQAEAQAATSRATLIAAKSTLQVQQNLMKQLITDQYAAWANIAVEPSGTLAAPVRFFNLQDSWSKALTQRPEILQTKLDLEKAGIQLKYDRNQLFPELDVFGTFGYNGSGTEFSGALYDIQSTDHPFYTYGGKISIPLGNRSARNTYKVSKMSLEQALLTLKKTERDIMVQIDNDIKLARSSYEQVGATRAAREYEEAALDAEQKKLENGKSTTYTVLQVQRDLTSARGNEIQALDTYNKNLSQLSFDEGTTLDRLGIDLQVK